MHMCLLRGGAAGPVATTGGRRNLIVHLGCKCNDTHEVEARDKREPDSPETACLNPAQRLRQGEPDLRYGTTNHQGRPTCFNKVIARHKGRNQCFRYPRRSVVILDRNLRLPLGELRLQGRMRTLDSVA